VLLADRSGYLIPVHLLRLLSESGDAGSFTWGSAVLAWLYKAMGRGWPSSPVPVRRVPVISEDSPCWSSSGPWRDFFT
ncbi:hypothetical protein LINPERPRIM_LOCUS26497, partial [Linum perenne]